MDRTQTAGGALVAPGVAGYVAGLVEAHPGRAVALTATMVGLALPALGGGGGSS